MFEQNVFMPVLLTTFETELLNRIIPTQTLSYSKSTQISLRNFIADDKEQIMAAQNISEAEFKALQVQSVKNIFTFLREQDFVGERDGGVNFLTEKGKNLRKQGSIEQYEVWRRQVRAENKVIMNTIETRGYLDQDEVNRNRRSVLMQRVRKFVLYPIIAAIVILFLLVAAHKYKLDDHVPFIKNFFDKGQSTEKAAAEDGDAKPKAARHKKRSE